MATVPVPGRAERLDLLARVLSDRPGITTAGLSRELAVSQRTVFRDLDALRERGYPIETSRGRGGGLRLPANWGLGRVLLSREEALCVMLGLAIADRIGLPMFSSALPAARRKIASAFPQSERRRLGPLRERIFVGAPASPAVKASYGEPSAALMRRLQVAFVDERIVRAEYVKDAGQRIDRRLEPHALIINWPAWYVLAYDHARAEPRTFRLDRFVAIEVEAQVFRPRARAMVEQVLRTAGVAVENL